MHLELCKNTFGGHGAGDRLRASGTPDANCARCLRDTYLPDEIMAYIDFVCGRTYILCLGLRLWTVASSVDGRTSPECMSGLVIVASDDHPGTCLCTDVESSL